VSHPFRSGRSGFYKGEALVARLDTGAGRTEFYEPFFRRYFSGSLDPSLMDTVKTGGAGGIRELPVYRLGRIDFTIGETPVRLDSAYTFTVTLTTDSQNYLFANIGLDLLKRFDELILNFRDMTFLVSNTGR
jgi:hypothetical protein